MTGVVVWFTGRPASGKTTLAREVRDRIARRTRAIVLDSDELRDVLATHAYTPDQRDAFYAALGRLAALLARQGHVVLVSATAPRRAHRDDARRAAPRFIEVHVATSLADAEARDIKGLYADARAGKAPDLPGLGAAYEPPAAAEVTASGGLDAAAADEIVRLL